MSYLYSIRRMCQTLNVHVSGFYAWRQKPKSSRQCRDEHHQSLIKHSWLESGAVYGYRKVWLDLLAMGESIGKNRVARLMSLANLKSQTGYRKKRGFYAGNGHLAHPNWLQRQFSVDQPNQSWVTDITYIRTHEGWLYLAVVLDLFSRKVIGWASHQRIDAELVVNALLMALRQWQPRSEVLVHSDQGVQYTSELCQHFMKSHRLKSSMSRRGNCHDNAVAESFFQLLKRERIKRHIYKTRAEAKSDVFNYIEMFYNPKRRHSACDNLAPVAYENAWNLRHQTV